MWTGNSEEAALVSTAVHCWKQQMELAAPQWLLCCISGTGLNFKPNFPIWARRACWSHCWSGQGSDLAVCLSACLTTHSIHCVSKLVVVIKMGAEISRCDKRDDATLLFSVEVLMYARIVFSKLKGLLSRKWSAARSIL